MQSHQALTVITAPPTRILTKNLTTGDSYDKVSRLTAAEQHPFDTLRELRTLLKSLAGKHHSCVIRGTLRDDAELPLLRRRSHFEDAPQAWVMLDIDDLKAPRKLRTWPYSDAHASYARAQLPAAFHNAGCVWQASASAGLNPKKLKLHLWFLLDAPLTSAQLRTWLRGAAHIDASTLRVVQPHYTADPIGGAEGKRLGILKGPRVTTPESINEVVEETTASLAARPDGCADVADAQIEGALKAAITRSRAVLSDPNVTGWQDSYRVGTYLGPAVALTTWNDVADGHETWQAYAEKLASKWGKRFAKLPDAKHSQEAYSERVLEGIAWGVANERERLSTRSEKAQAEAIERTKELRERILKRVLTNCGSVSEMEKAAAQLSKYREACPELVDQLTANSGLSRAMVEQALSVDEPVRLDSWRAGLAMRKDEIKPVDGNLLSIFRSYPGFRESFEFNVRTGSLEVVAGNVLKLRQTGATSLDTISVALMPWLESLGMREMSLHRVYSVLHAYLPNFSSYDPFLRRYPQALWKPEDAAEALGSRKPVLDRWLVKHFGADPSLYVKAAGSRALIGAVARAVVPGSQVDTMLVLMGAQGIGKTTALRTLGGVIEQGYTELLSMQDKDSILSMHTSVIVEVSELRALRTSQEESVKAFMTRKVDKLRAPYARAAEEKPRRMVFIGTTNDDQFLTDHVNRRYWPIACKTQCRMTAEQADKLWQEAALRYASGEAWWLDTQDLLEGQAEAASNTREDNIVESVLRKQLRRMDKVTLLDATRMVFPDTSDAHRHSRAVGKALRALGWELTHTRKGNFWVKSEG